MIDISCGAILLLYSLLCVTTSIVDFIAVSFKLYLLLTLLQQYKSL